MCFHRCSLILCVVSQKSSCLLPSGNSAWASKGTQYLCPQNRQCFHLIAGIYPKNVSLPTVADMCEWTPSFLPVVLQAPDCATTAMLHCDVAIIVTAKYPCCWMSFPKSRIWGTPQFLRQWLRVSLRGMGGIWQISLQECFRVLTYKNLTLPYTNKLLFCELT